MNETFWNYYPSAALARIEELEEFVETFPESPLSPIFEREIEQLKQKYSM